MSDLKTIDEAAKDLRKPAGRWLRDWLHDHPPPAGEPAYYLQAGRDRLFSPQNIARIEARLWELTSCRSSSYRRVKAKARIGRSAGHTSESQWTEAQEATGVRLLPDNCARSSGGSSVVNFPKKHRHQIRQPS
jgi:hypothetical protein